MVEIALSIAIVALAMVALIGVLPSGLQVQKDNREETVVNQDGTFLLEALRGGVAGIPDLTKYVEKLESTDISLKNGEEIETMVASSLPGSGLLLSDSETILDLLSRISMYWDPDTSSWVRNRTAMLMRPISGDASQRMQDPDFRESAFTYLVTPTILPYSLPSSQVGDRPTPSRNVVNNLYHVRLHFRWPVADIHQEGLTDVDYPVGSKEKVFNALISGSRAEIEAPFHSEPLVVFRSHQYQSLPR